MASLLQRQLLQQLLGWTSVNSTAAMGRQKETHKSYWYWQDQRNTSNHTHTHTIRGWTPLVMAEYRAAAEWGNIPAPTLVVALAWVWTVGVGMERGWDEEELLVALGMLLDKSCDMVVAAAALDWELAKLEPACCSCKDRVAVACRSAWIICNWDASMRGGGREEWEETEAEAGGGGAGDWEEGEPLGRACWITEDDPTYKNILLYFLILLHSFPWKRLITNVWCMYYYIQERNTIPFHAHPTRGMRVLILKQDWYFASSRH